MWQMDMFLAFIVFLVVVALGAKLWREDGRDASED